MAYPKKTPSVEIDEKKTSTFQGTEIDLTKPEFRNEILKKCMWFG